MLATCKFAIAALVLMSPLGLAAGQDIPSHFVHGIRSDGNTWKQTADRLAQEFAISQTYPNLNDSRPFSEQAAQLDAFAGSAPGVIAVGHSNGGQVARVWNLNHGRNNRIATVGSLNHGARLATNVLNGSALVMPVGAAIHIVETVAHYVDLEIELHGFGSGLPVSIAAWNAVDNIVNFMYNMPSLLAQPGLGFVAQSIASSSYPVMFDMDPTSSYWYPAGLNSPSNLTREAQTMTQRVGIVGRYGYPEGIFFNALMPGSANAWQDVRYFAYDVALALYQHYYWDIGYTNDPILNDMRQNAYHWLMIANDMAMLDVYWLEQIGALIGPGSNGGWYWEDSDGIVTESSQRYPGGTNNRFVPGAVHLKQTSSEQVYQQLRLTFQGDFVVPLRAGSPGGSLSVSIDGPTQIRPGATCTWTATVSGGSAPYNYQWTNDGASVGNGQEYTGSKNPGNTGSSFQLSVAATAPGGLSGNGVITVYENSSAPICFI